MVTSYQQIVGGFLILTCVLIYYNLVIINYVKSLENAATTLNIGTIK